MVRFTGEKKKKKCGESILFFLFTMEGTTLLEQMGQPSQVLLHYCAYVDSH